MGENLLSALAVKNAKPDADPDKTVRFGDGGGLALLVKGPSRKWVYRFTYKGRVKEMGLGPANEVALADARKARDVARKLVRAGINPIEAKKADRKKVPTFGEIADKYIAKEVDGWRNATYRAQWYHMMWSVDPKLGVKRDWQSERQRPYAKSLRPIPVDQIDRDDVLRVLEPIWKEIPHTANRLRIRIALVLGYAKALKIRTGDNPAAWEELKDIMPKHAYTEEAHHAALPYARLPSFMADLRQQSATSARALEFTILTAARSGEVYGARWSEIDIAEKTWTIPGSRMKKGKEHRVPLSSDAMAILDHMSPGRKEFVFPGQRRGRPLTKTAMFLVLTRMQLKGAATVHGFRSTFRDWAGDVADVPREITEEALSHTVGNTTERAYRRGNAFEKRRTLMDQWADFCRGATGVVIPMFEERDHVQAA